ncbi:SAM-dependent methyltransferase [Streptosporangium sp. NPDC051022]|uniref:SAM-dependent methyltransferase n=1 Tax=Streptosporangium sp. NPDC051022 TaxID=3155752 RepID=UPI00341D244F
MMNEVDLSTPSPARVYDYLLGGTHNSEADRRVAEQVMQAWPVRELALANRRFLVAAVQHLTSLGIRQFIDIGSGLPTGQNVHQVAAPDARVLYVDNDPLAVTEGRLLLDGETTSYIEGDLRDPQGIIDHPELNRLLDWTAPAALLLIGMMHYIKAADDPIGIIRGLMSRLAPGSYLVISTATDELPAEMRARIDEYYRAPNSLLVWRSWADVEQFFDGLELEPPGLVPVEQWPDTTATPGPWRVAAGVARMP